MWLDVQKLGMLLGGDAPIRGKQLPPEKAGLSEPHPPCTEEQDRPKCVAAAVMHVAAASASPNGGELPATASTANGESSASGTHCALNAAHALLHVSPNPESTIVCVLFEQDDMSNDTSASAAGGKAGGRGGADGGNGGGDGGDGAS